MLALFEGLEHIGWRVANIALWYNRVRRYRMTRRFADREARDVG
jgi:hypothetical protein